MSQFVLCWCLIHAIWNHVWFLKLIILPFCRQKLKALILRLTLEWNTQINRKGILMMRRWRLASVLLDFRLDMHLVSDAFNIRLRSINYIILLRWKEVAKLILASCFQMGTNKCASQAGMTAYGTRRHLYDPKTQTDKPYDQTTISLQMGTNKGASQVHPLNTLALFYSCVWVKL